MPKKNKDHTGFRNGNLFCFNCGEAYDMHMPQPISMATAMMAQFAKDHKNCQPVWKVPVNDPTGKTEKENAVWWIENGEHGTSSKAMFNCLSSTNHFSIMYDHDRIAYPRDPDDFRRCHLLLEAIPQWKTKLDKLKTLSDVWQKLVANWDKLTEMLLEQMKTNKPNGMYELMGKLTSKQ